MNRRSIPLLLLVLLIPALVMTLPLRVGLTLIGGERSPLSAMAAEGSIWSGRLIDARIGAVPLGDPEVGLKFWPLFVGRQRLAIEADADPAMMDAHYSALGFQRSGERWIGELPLEQK